MLTLSGAEQYFAGLVVLDCQPIQAECINLFVASSAENRLQYLPGFAGAAFTASLCGRYALELVCWKTPAVLAAARTSPVFLEHVAVVEHHAKRLHAGFSSRYEILSGVPISLQRGDRIAFALYKPLPVMLPGEMRDRLLAVTDSRCAPTLAHIAEDGSSLALFSRDAFSSSASPDLATAFGEPHFQDDFTVVETVDPSPNRVAYEPLYRVALPTAS
jgi:hypothetical protein